MGTMPDTTKTTPKKTAKAPVKPALTVSLTGLLSGAACLAAEKYLGAGSGAILAAFLTGGALYTQSPNKK